MYRQNHKKLAKKPKTTILAKVSKDLRTGVSNHPRPMGTNRAITCGPCVCACCAVCCGGLLEQVILPSSENFFVKTADFIRAVRMYGSDKILVLPRTFHNDESFTEIIR